MDLIEEHNALKSEYQEKEREYEQKLRDCEKDKLNQEQGYAIVKKKITFQKI